jgi:hypothetical protein
MSSAKPMPRRLRPALVVAIGTAGAVLFATTMLGMPGRSHRGPLPPLDEAGRKLAAELEASVVELARTIGERNHVRARALDAAAASIGRDLEQAGLAVRREEFTSGRQTFANLCVEIAGTRVDEIVVVGAHYDSVIGSPGANDNASGVAALLALARRFAREKPARTLRFVAFANEEPPWFQGDAMGSLVHARGCKERGENVVAMLSLETIGYYSDAAQSQTYPVPLLGWIYPSTGDFVAFVGDLGSRALVERAVSTFRSSVAFPCEGAALPASVPGAGWSDHWAFWEAGYPALMVTDTAPFRYPWYHTADDTPERLDYDRFARVVLGIEAVLRNELD